MTTRQHTPATLDVIAPDQPAPNGRPVRLSFRPFGRRKFGDPDPDAPGYQRVDARAILTATPPSGRAVYLRDVSGRRLVLAQGDEFRTTGRDTPAGIDPVSLADGSPVLGAEAADGNGYVAVGTDTVLLLPDA